MDCCFAEPKIYKQKNLKKKMEKLKENREKKERVAAFLLIFLHKKTEAKNMKKNCTLCHCCQLLQYRDKLGQHQLFATTFLRRKC